MFRTFCVSDRLRSWCDISGILCFGRLFRMFRTFCVSDRLRNQHPSIWESQQVDVKSQRAVRRAMPMGPRYLFNVISIKINTENGSFGAGLVCECMGFPSLQNMPGWAECPFA